MRLGGWTWVFVDRAVAIRKNRHSSLKLFQVRIVLRFDPPRLRKRVDEIVQVFAARQNRRQSKVPYMSIQEKVRWKNWADQLRKDMMTSLTPEVTKSVNSITQETATTKAESTLRSVRFWKSCQAGKSPNDTLVMAGFVIEFQEEERVVSDITLRLNQTWMSIMQRVIDRKPTTA